MHEYIAKELAAEKQKEAVGILFATETEDQNMDMTPALIPLRTDSPTEDQDVPTKDHWLRGSRHVARTSTSISTRD